MGKINYVRSCSHEKWYFITLIKYENVMINEHGNGKRGLQIHMETSYQFLKT